MRTFLSSNLVRCTIRCNLLELPLLRKLLAQFLQLVDEVLAGLHDGLLGRDGAVSLHTQLEDSKERVRDLVGSEDDVGRFHELRPEQVAESMVFFVEGKHGGIGDAWDVAY